MNASPSHSNAHQGQSQTNYSFSVHFVGLLFHQPQVLFPIQKHPNDSEKHIILPKLLRHHLHLLDGDKIPALLPVVQLANSNIPWCGRKASLGIAAVKGAIVEEI
jgi:hypothetical protein